MRFLASPRFWFIGIGSVSTVLLREDFSLLPWNQIVGQILSIWMSGAAGIGLWDRTVDKLSAPKVVLASEAIPAEENEVSERE